MSFFSSCIRIIFITALALSLHSGNSLVVVKPERTRPFCKEYVGKYAPCPNVLDPVCAKNGRTYKNECYFCVIVLDSYRRIKFRHYGRCRG